MTSLGVATYTGHIPVSMGITGIVVITVLMLLATVIVHVMPQNSEHRVASIKLILDHRRKMTVLKQQARVEARQPAPLTVLVIPQRAAPNLSPASTRQRRSSRTLSG